MKLIPQIEADLDEYPELRPLADAALRRVAELMSAHAIIELRRLHKRGVFDHPYTKDIVTPINLPTVPQTVFAGQQAAGKALLDYLESIGMSGLQLEVTQDDVNRMASLWAPPQKEPQGGADNLDPKPAEDRKDPDPGQEKAAENPNSSPAEQTDASSKQEKEG